MAAPVAFTRASAPSRLAELERKGHDSTHAKELLAVFLATQAAHVAGRDRPQEELKRS